MVHKCQRLTLKRAVVELGEREYVDLWQFYGSVLSKIFYLGNFYLRDLKNVKGYKKESLTAMIL
jgi:hypothetical protein